VGGEERWVKNEEHPLGKRLTKWGKSEVRGEIAQKWEECRTGEKKRIKAGQ